MWQRQINSNITGLLADIGMILLQLPMRYEIYASVTLFRRQRRWSIRRLIARYWWWWWRRCKCWDPICWRNIVCSQLLLTTGRWCRTRVTMMTIPVTICRQRSFSSWQFFRRGLWSSNDCWCCRQLRMSMMVAFRVRMTTVRFACYMLIRIRMLVLVTMAFMLAMTMMVVVLPVTRCWRLTRANAATATRLIFTRLFIFAQNQFNTSDCRWTRWLRVWQFLYTSFG